MNGSKQAVLHSRIALCIFLAAGSCFSLGSVAGELTVNVTGLPTEQWGVSNNARPALRAPRFCEAVFSIASETPNFSIDIKVAK